MVHFLGPGVIDGEVVSVVDWPPPANGGPAMNDVRRYRLRVYDGQYEVLHKRTIWIDLDLNSAYVPQVLNDRLVALTRQAREIDNEYMGSPRLEVCDWQTGHVVMDWTG